MGIIDRICQKLSLRASDEDLAKIERFDPMPYDEEQVHHSDLNAAKVDEESVRRAGSHVQAFLEKYKIEK